MPLEHYRVHKLVRTRRSPIGKTLEPTTLGSCSLLLINIFLSYYLIDIHTCMQSGLEDDIASAEPIKVQMHGDADGIPSGTVTGKSS